MSARPGSDFKIMCPCCGAQLRIDAQLGQVIDHESPPKQAKAPDLDRARQLLEKEAERREALFRQSAEDEKVKGDLLERKFEEALKKTKDQPPTRPLRDIDFD